MKHEYKLTDNLIYFTLDEFRKNDLIEGDYISPLAGMNRREVIRKIGLTSAIALPVISSLIAPTALQAASACVYPGGLAPSNFLGRCSDTVGSAASTPTFCVRPSPGTTECCSGGLINSPGGCVTASGIYYL